MRRPILFSTVLLLCLVWAACQMPLSPADTRKTPVVGPVAESRHDVSISVSGGFTRGRGRTATC